jgi:hypothetical protein
VAGARAGIVNPIVATSTKDVQNEIHYLIQQMND